MFRPLRTLKPRLLLPAIELGIMVHLLSSCVVADFHKVTPVTAANVNTNASGTCFTTEDLKNTAVPDPCFGNHSTEFGYYAFSLLISVFKPIHTTLTGTDDRATSYMVTETDEDGALWVAHPYLAKNGTDIHYQITKLNPNQQNNPSPPPTYPAEDASGLAISDILIDQKNESNQRLIYYAGTIHQGSVNTHEFFVCRLLEDGTTKNLSADKSFGSGTTHCRYFPSIMIDFASFGSAAQYNPIPASTKPVRIAFHMGSDGVRRVVAVGICSNPVGIEYITLIPVRVSDGLISGPNGPLNTITKWIIGTQRQGSAFTSGPNMRALRIFGFETDPLDGYSPSFIYLGFEFLNDQDSAGSTASGTGTFKTYDGPYPRAEHFILRLNSTLSEVGFGEDYSERRGIYIPAESIDGTSQSFLNNRPISTASNLSSMRVRQGHIYVMGLHVDQASLSSSPTSLGYKLLKYPTNATNSSASQSITITSATSCNLAAHPAFDVSREDLMVVSCAQSNSPGGNNFLIREHSPTNLAVMNRIGSATNENALIRNGFEGLTQHSPNVNLYYDEDLGGHFLYRGWISLLYPQFLRTWQN